LNALRSRAIRLLARREHTRAELANKLAAHGTQEEINAVIAELQACHLQSDARFAESYVHSQAPRLGILRLRHHMLTKGLDHELVESLLVAADMPQTIWCAPAAFGAESLGQFPPIPKNGHVKPVFCNPVGLPAIPFDACSKTLWMELKPHWWKKHFLREKKAHDNWNHNFVSA
jgi:hypothetical protein